MKLTRRTECRTANSTYPKGGFSCSKDRFVVNGIFGGLFLALVGIVFVGCNKEQIIQQNSSEIDESNQMQLKSNAVVYANLSCELPNGETGCQCTITQSDDDCELQTACTAQSSLPNYSDALEEMFTREEIQYRARNNVRITERELIEALKKDRFPLK